MRAGQINLCETRSCFRRRGGRQQHGQRQRHTVKRDAGQFVIEKHIPFEAVFHIQKHRPRQQRRFGQGHAFDSWQFEVELFGVTKDLQILHHNQSVVQLVFSIESLNDDRVGQSHPIVPIPAVQGVRQHKVAHTAIRACLVKRVRNDIAPTDAVVQHRNVKVIFPGNRIRTRR